LVALADVLMLPCVYCSALLLGTIRRLGVFKFPHCKNALLNVGVFPLSNHYYEPRFDYRNIKNPFSRERILPGIDWNVKEQLGLLDMFSFSEELEAVTEGEVV
jgi:hypothetical protein